jgi:predicted nucleic acid-binding protein
VIVVDGSVAVLAVLDNTAAREVLLGEDLHAPAVIDIEVLGALRHLLGQGVVRANDAAASLEAWRYMAVFRHRSFADLERMWELRDNLTASDAAYVSLAEALNCDLVTADRHLAGAPGVRCPVTVIAAVS